MEKYIFDERNGLWYELQDDYYLPCLKLPEVFFASLFCIKLQEVFVGCCTYSL